MDGMFGRAEEAADAWPRRLALGGLTLLAVAAGGLAAASKDPEDLAVAFIAAAAAIAQGIPPSRGRVVFEVWCALFIGVWTAHVGRVVDMSVVWLAGWLPLAVLCVADVTWIFMAADADGRRALRRRLYMIFPVIMYLWLTASWLPQAR